MSDLKCLFSLLLYFLRNECTDGTICILISYMYVLPASKKCRGLVAHQIYKGCSSWIKKAGTSHNATNAEKRFKYEKPKEKTPERIFNTKWYEGHPWLKYDRDENVMTCTICTKYGKRGETGNLKKLVLEVEHEIEREFI